MSLRVHDPARRFLRIGKGNPVGRHSPGLSYVIRIRSAGLTWNSPTIGEYFPNTANPNQPGVSHCPTLPQKDSDFGSRFKSAPMGDTRLMR